MNHFKMQFFIFTIRKSANMSLQPVPRKAMHHSIVRIAER